MQNWVNFFILLFWIIFGIIACNNTNFLNTIIITELVWLVLYCLSICIGVTNDDLILFSLSFFILALAGLEFSLGFLLIILFRYFFKNLDFLDNETNINNKNVNFANTFLKRYTLL